VERIPRKLPKKGAKGAHKKNWWRLRPTISLKARPRSKLGPSVNKMELGGPPSADLFRSGKWIGGECEKKVREMN